MIDPGLRVLLLMAVIGGLVMGEVLARLLPGWGYPRGKAVMRRAMLIGAGGYGILLLAVSFTSHEVVLQRSETLRFCGFYLDCHMGVAVDSVTRVEQIGSLRAQSSYYIVAIRVSSDARAATLRLNNPAFAIRDAAGHRYLRALDAERALAEGVPSSAPLVRPVAAGMSYVAQIVFDLPTDMLEPRLLVTDVSGVDRMLEGLLIGDEDSFFHKPTTLALQVTSRPHRS